MDRDFKGVWISKEIWLNEELGWSEKLLLVEIDSLAKNGECFATNEYFAQFFKMHKNSISRLISNLVKLGLISVELIYKSNSKQIEKRIIHVNTPINKNDDTPKQKCLEGIDENVNTPINKNVKDSSFINNTVINNTISNTTNKNNKRNLTDLEFDELWKLYPRKMGNKKKAKESYLKAVKKGEATYESVKNGIEMYIKYNEYHNVEEQYIKHGSTWFNQQGWNDDYACKPKVIQGRRHGFLGLVLNEMDYQHTDIIDHEKEIIDGQARNKETVRYDANSLPFGVQGL